MRLSGSFARTESRNGDQERVGNDFHGFTPSAPRSGTKPVRTRSVGTRAFAWGGVRTEIGKFIPACSLAKQEPGFLF